MNKTGFLFDERFLLHETGPYHPEIPERLIAIFKGIKDADLLPKLKPLKADRASRKWIEAGSPCEVEIRAATVWAVELLRRELERRGRSLLAVEVDWLLWHTSQRRQMPPHHRTRTTFY